MIYREHCIRNFIVNDKIEDRRYNEFSNYRYALNLIPKKKTYKKTQRIFLEKNGQYRLNSYDSRTASRTKKFYSKSPLRHTKNKGFYNEIVKTEPTCIVLPEIEAITNYRSLTIDDYYRNTVYSKLNHIEDNYKRCKDIGLSTNE